jgi:hypothetical protein
MSRNFPNSSQALNLLLLVESPAAYIAFDSNT